MIDRFRCVIPGILYRGSAPNVEDLKILKNLGIKKIVSLDEDAGNSIDHPAKLLGLAHINLPIDVGNRGTIINFLQQDLGQVFLTNGPTFMHCHYGKDRTGMAAALIRMKYQGWDCQKALQEALSLDFGIGMDKQNKDLFTKIVKDNCPKCQAEGKINPKKEDANDAEDIVSGGRDSLEYSNEAISGLSWAPYTDNSTRGFPYTSVQLRNNETDTDNQYPTRQDRELDDSDFWKHIDEQIEIPGNGEFADSSPVINGLGPSALNNAFV